MKPQNPCSNHEIHVLFEDDFNLKSLNWALICMHDVTLESVAVVTDHFDDTFIRVYMTLWRRNDVRKFTLTPFCFKKSSVRKGMFKRRFQRGLCWNLVKYARITITLVCFIALTLAGSLGRCLNTRPNGFVFKQLPRDPANVNAWKNMCAPYTGLQIFGKRHDFYNNVAYWLNDKIITIYGSNEISK